MHLKEVVMKKYFAALLILLFFAWPSFAADPNGYTALYECRAGGTHCNVDVVSLSQRECDQKISASTPWSSINWSNNTICIEAGDHTSKGTLTIPSSASGNSGNYKVLRYYRAGDSNDEPWNQSAVNRAKISKMSFSGNFWIIHRLTIDGSGVNNSATLIAGSNLILSRLLAQDYNSNILRFDDGGANKILQNSVVRQSVKLANSDRHCIQISGTQVSIYIVNNEIYDCAGDGLQTSRGSVPRDLIIENNDIYATSAMYCNSDGTPNVNGVRSASENALDIKEAGDDPALPLQAIHNRFWGFRSTSSNCGGSGSAGEAAIFHNNSSTVPGATNKFGIFQNNIVWDGTKAFAAPNATPERFSIIGNLIYDMTHQDGGPASAIDIGKAESTEVYLNTIIASIQGIGLGSSDTNDARCNVVISSDTSSGTASQFSHNVYYDSSNANEAIRIDIPVNTRTSVSAYSVGKIIRTSTSSNCFTGTESACFLYRVTRAGTSAPGEQSYCTTLGCTQQDGTMQLRAIRGPYSFYHKLRTSPERYTIPYALVYAGATNIAENAPEAYACPSDYNTRPGIGIN